MDEHEAMASESTKFATLACNGRAGPAPPAYL